MSVLPSMNSFRLRRWQGLVPIIAAREPALMQLSDYELKKASLALKYRAKSGESLDRLLPEAYALVREAGRRRLNMRHYDVQMIGGAAMHFRSIAEMQTGEGKTLTATLPLYLASLEGKGAHLATVNDYLARRDAEWMKPLYDALGTSVGIVESQMPQPQRAEAYACDITYGTAKEFGFDFLRDRLLLRRQQEGLSDFLGGMLGHRDGELGGGGDKPVQRANHFVLVDEADSILIDEARTPLIISALPTEEQKTAVEAYAWCAQNAEQFKEGEHYEYDHDKRTVELNFAGRQLARRLNKPPAMDRMGMFHILEYIERAIKVARDFIRDRQFVIRDGEIVIVDEFTGRLAEGRKWRAGIHQAVEAKEGVKISAETGQAARVTIQDFFLLYKRLGGMTGTAATSAPELRKIYNVNCVPIPTNRPAIRKRLPDRIFGSEEQKFHAIVEEVREQHALQRPVLIGTRSIDKSVKLSKLLQEAAIPHEILNANRVAEEAKIVSEAGHLGRVTVSTNMAGRGTDIKLGPGVHEIGGLHVICTELHEAARIDRQLIGRCGRQGDPGTYRQFLALDDEILEGGLGPQVGERMKKRGQAYAGEFSPGLIHSFKRAQRRVEKRHFVDRKVLMHHERERKKLQIQMGQDPYLDTPG